MNIMWVSVAPWIGTGYGQQTALFAERIRDAGHNLAISASHGLFGTEMNWRGIPVHGGDSTGHNKRVLKQHVAKAFGDEPCKVIMLYDLWPLIDRKFGGLTADFQGLDIAAWCPVDHLPCPPGVLAAIDEFRIRPIAMSQFGREQLEAKDLDPLYVPHGVDTQVYQPVDRDEAAKAVKTMIGIPEEKFVVGMVANNQGVTPPRKAFPQVLQAFKVFRDHHEDVVLYLHTEVTGVYDGLNLVAMAANFGIPDDALAACPQIPYLNGDFSPSRMNLVYNRMDVLANPSYGEGFGVPIIEAQACGVPVIVSEWTSMPELVGAGWTVGGIPWYNPASGAWYLDPSTEDIIGALEAAYEKRGDEETRAKAREFALAYDADTVMDTYWKPVLEELGRPREVPPLRPLNREMRRKLKAAA